MASKNLVKFSLDFGGIGDVRPKGATQSRAVESIETLLAISSSSETYCLACDRLLSMAYNRWSVFDVFQAKLDANLLFAGGEAILDRFA